MDFWNRLQKLISDNEIVIDRPKGSIHPKYKNFIMSLDYGFLKGTLSNDKNEIDVWKGSLDTCKLTGIVCTVDSMKKDSEIKLLIGCKEYEIDVLSDFYKFNKYMSGLIIKNSMNKNEN